MRGMKLVFDTCIEYMDYVKARKSRAKEITEELEKMGEIKIELKNERLWEESIKTEYDAKLQKIATKWAKAMELLMARGFDLEEIAGEALDICDPYDGLTGYAESYLVSLLSQCWQYGDNLRLWYNKNHGGYVGKGIANPAKMIIG